MVIKTTNILEKHPIMIDTPQDTSAKKNSAPKKKIKLKRKQKHYLLHLLMKKKSDLWRC